MRKKIIVILTCVLMVASGIALTGTTVAHWDEAEGDTHKMHWAQTPDTSPTGVAVDMPLMQLRGDDFLCTESGYINDIHIWGAFYNDDLPNLGADGLVFWLSIYSNIPPTAYPYFKPWSMPGYLLWSKAVYIGQYTVTQTIYPDPMDWYYPIPPSITPDTHKDVYQYNFHFNNTEAFYQVNGTTYWLVVRQYFTSSGEDFGWMATKNSLHWNDNAVRPTPAAWNWEPMEYPDGDAVDLAFVINGTSLPTLTIPPWIFTPLTLNLWSKGRWVTGMVTLPDNLTVGDIDMDTVRLEDNIPVEWYKKVGTEKLMLKFDRSELEDMILGGSPFKPAEFKISGRLLDGTPFVGYSEPVNLVTGPIKSP